MSGKMSVINEGQMGMGYTYIYIYIYVVYTVYIGDILSENGLLPHVWPMSSKLIWKMNEHYVEMIGKSWEHHERILDILGR